MEPKGTRTKKWKLSYRSRVNPPDALPGGPKINLFVDPDSGPLSKPLFWNLCCHFCPQGAGMAPKLPRNCLQMEAQIRQKLWQNPLAATVGVPWHLLT